MRNDKSDSAKSNVRWMISTCSILGTASMAAAAVNIGVQQVTIPKGANQILDVGVNPTAGDVMSGTELFVQINDGGIDNGGIANNGGSTSPTLTGIDLTEGIFNGNNDGNTSDLISPDGLVGFDAINSDNGTVSASGILGTLTLNTSNMAIGSTFYLYFYNVGDVYFDGDSTLNPDAGEPSFYNNPSNIYNFSGSAMSSPLIITVANSSQWTNGSGNHSWNTAANWSPSGVLNGQAAIANFTSVGAGSVTLDGNHTIGKININSLSPYTISKGSSGTLTINDAGDAVVSPQINIQAGSHVISAPIALVQGVNINFAFGTGLTLAGAVSGSGSIDVNGAGNLAIATTGTLPAASSLSINTGATVALAVCTDPSNPTIQTVASLTFDAASGSKLDISNNEMIITTATPAQVLSEISKHNIVSSLANSARGVGYMATAGGTEIRYTVLGDANLDGSVNFSDLLALAANYGSTSAVWSMGDFNYDGTVNFTDLLTLAANYGDSLTPGETSEFSPAFAADWSLAVSETSAVPEPASLGFLAIGLTAMALTRRTRASSSFQMKFR